MSGGNGLPIFFKWIRTRFALHRGHSLLDLLLEFVTPTRRLSVESAHFLSSKTSSATFMQSRPQGEAFNLAST